MPFNAEQAYELLSRAHARDRFAHAYLITGPLGSGKRAVAERLCALLTGAETGGALRHPDVHRLEPESKSRRILIEQIRELERNLQMCSSLNCRKVGVVFDADRLQPNAANAFLKTLEEPPRHSHLILLSSAPDQLLETIVSRCLEVPMRSDKPTAPTAQQTKLLHALRTSAPERNPGLVMAFTIVRSFNALLAETKEAIQAETDGAFAKEEKHFKQTSEAGKWLDDREDYYKALVESRYLAARDGLLDTIEQWWADALRQQTGAGDFPAAALLDHPEFTAETAALAERHSTPELLRKTAALSTLRERLANPGVQEQLAIECAFLEAFAA